MSKSTIITTLSTISCTVLDHLSSLAQRDCKFFGGTRFGTYICNGKCSDGKDGEYEEIFRARVRDEFMGTMPWLKDAFGNNCWFGTKAYCCKKGKHV